MKRLGRIVSATGFGLLSWTGVAVAQTAGSAQQGNAPPPSSGSAAGQPSSSTVGQVMSASATVEKVNLQKRDVSLKDSDGNEFVVNVPAEVSRLDAVKKGDRVSVTYKQSLALSLKKGGTMSAPSETQMSERNAGNLPGGSMGRQISAAVKVTKVDPENNKITFRDSSGTIDTINVTDPAMQSDLKQLKAGDKIRATYTEAVAMSVTPKNKE
ncbi:MAG TPA: hypothetical protein VGH63_17140 [Polyangia bacterium]